MSKYMFEKIYIELSDFCGLKCGFCPSSGRQWAQIRGAMDLGLFERVCEQIAGKARRVCLHILGDPLGVENLADYVEILKAHHLKVDVVSTGLFLKEDLFDLLLQDPFAQVSFSLSAFLANPKSLTDRHLQRILTFAQLNIQHYSPIFVNLRFHSADIESQSVRYSEMLSMIADCFGLDEIALGSDRVRLGAKVFLVPTKSFEWHLSKSADSLLDQSQAIRCYGAIKQIGILSDGRVVPCCIDYEGRATFGSLMQSYLSEILDSEMFRKFAQSLKNGQAPCELCAQCGYHLIIKQHS